MALAQEISSFIRKMALERFLEYVRIDTTSDENSGKHPSSERQFGLSRLLAKELKELGLQDVEVDGYSYVYATLPASPGVNSITVSLIAHIDTSPSVSGENVIPALHEKYDGRVLRFADDPELQLDPIECPILLEHMGDTIITASGKTLLGADDKAGVAEIMTALAALRKFGQLRHPELRICFTPDEEIGEGTARIRLDRLGQVAYTLDGSVPGELEDECFDAYSSKIKFSGLNVHPGQAKNKMINAGAIAARFASMIPEWQTPEHSELREGFFHLTRICGNESEAELTLILRDFEKNKNSEKLVLLDSLKEFFLKRHPGLKIFIETKEQYQNMKELLSARPEVVDIARKAIEMAGLKVQRNAIRGGTDGARLTWMGVPTPNLFTGGVFFHSKKEWIGHSSLEKASETLIHLCDLWARRH